MYANTISLAHAYQQLGAANAEARRNVYEGQETIIDFKQSNKPKKEEWIEDYYLQLGAYSLAHNVVHNSKITQGIVLLCTVDNLFQDFRIQGAKLEEYQNKFLEKVEQFYHQRNMN